MSKKEVEWTRFTVFAKLEVRDGKIVCDNCEQTLRTVGFVDGKQHWVCGCTYTCDECGSPKIWGTAHGQLVCFAHAAEKAQ